MEWINVKDRLPENESYILLHDSCEGVVEGYYHTGIFTYFFYANECNDEAENVTHWMPLPKPPEKNFCDIIDRPKK